MDGQADEQRGQQHLVDSPILLEHSPRFSPTGLGLRAAVGQEPRLDMDVLTLALQHGELPLVV